VVDCVDEEGEAEDVGEEDEFLEDIPLVQYLSADGEGGGERTCRTSLDIWPTFTRKFNAAIHSAVLNRVSRAKSWRCVTSLSITYVRR